MRNVLIEKMSCTKFVLLLAIYSLLMYICFTQTQQVVVTLKTYSPDLNHLCTTLIDPSQPFPGLHECGSTTKIFRNISSCLETSVYAYYTKSCLQQ